MITNSKVIVITSGKGGVGKTTTAAAIGSQIAKEGHKTVIIDFDIGLRNLDLIMGCERRVVYDFINVINNESLLFQALIQDKREKNLFILAASQTSNKECLNKKSVGNILEKLKEKFEYIICDSPAGIEKGALVALYFADEAIIVTNPEISSVRDSDRIIGLIDSCSLKAENNLEMKKSLLITRYEDKRVKKGEMLSVEDVKEILAIPLLGIIPESHLILNSSNNGVPVTLTKNISEVYISYVNASNKILGKEQIEYKNQDNWAKKILSRFGFDQ